MSGPSGGEFAFVLFGLAATFGIMDTETAERLVLVVTASMILSPVFLLLHDSWFRLGQPGKDRGTLARTSSMRVE